MVAAWWRCPADVAQLRLLIFISGRCDSFTEATPNFPVCPPRSVMSISTDSYTAVAGQVRQATEKSVEVFRNAAQSFTDQLDAVTFPVVDLTQPVTRYFEYVQKAVDVNRDLLIRWAELVSTLSGSVREQAEKVNGIVKDQTDTVADLTVKQAQKAEQAAKEQAEKAEQVKRAQAEEAEEAEKAKVREAKRVEREEARKAQQQAEEAEEAEKAKAREAKRIEREEARKAQQKARAAYEGLTKAELSGQLAKRGLPKTGNVEDLIERLVSADTE
jgi:flagellar biosynthesis GTPase FlhF